MWYVIYSDELFHHGIKGQKWGVRRYQNPDGTLTPAGERRYKKLNDRYEKQKRKISFPYPYATETEKPVESRAERGKQIAKKAAVGVAVTAGVAALAAGAVYAKRHPQEVKAVVYGLRNMTVEAVRSRKKKAYDAGKAFLKEETENVKKGIKSAVHDGSRELVKGLAGLSVSAEAAKLVKKIEASGELDEQSRKILIDASDKSVNSFTSAFSYNSTSGNTNKGNNDSQKKYGTGKELSKKVGKPTQEHYSAAQERQYTNFFKMQKVRDNDEVRGIVKSLRKQGFTPEQIQVYINSV